MMRRDLYFALRGTVARAHVRRLATRTSSCVGSRLVAKKSQAIASNRAAPIFLRTLATAAAAQPTRNPNLQLADTQQALESDPKYNVRIYLFCFVFFWPYTSMRCVCWARSLSFSGCASKKRSAFRSGLTSHFCIVAGGSVDWPSTRLVVDRTYTADDRPSGCAAGDQYAQLHACVVARSIRRTVAVDRDAFRLVTR